MAEKTKLGSVTRNFRVNSNYPDVKSFGAPPKGSTLMNVDFSPANSYDNDMVIDLWYPDPTNGNWGWHSEDWKPGGYYSEIPIKDNQNGQVQVRIAHSRSTIMTATVVVTFSGIRR